MNTDIIEVEAVELEEGPIQQGEVKKVMVEPELVKRLKDKDERALAELIRDNERLLRNCVYQILRNDADSDEVVSSSFQEVWENMGDFDPAKGAFGGWIITLFRRRAIDRVRRSQSYATMQGKVQVIEEIREKEASRKNHLWETDSGEDRHTRLKELVYSVLIPDEQRECLLLHWFEGMSQRDIAEKLHIPLGTIKTRLELGFKTLSELVCRDPTCCEEYQSSESNS